MARIRTVLIIVCAMALAGAAAAQIRMAPRVFTSGSVYHVAVCPGPAPRGHMRCFAHVVTDRAGNPLVNRFVPNRYVRNIRASFVPQGFSPLELNEAYNPAVATSYPTGVGKSSTIVAVADAYGYVNAEADLQVYRNQYGLPTCTTANGCFSKVNQEGTKKYYPAQNVGWAQETALDLDMVSAMCPNCKIILVESNDDSGYNLALAANRAALLGAHVISNSYGGNEEGPGPDYNSLYNHPGVAITASTGDDGWVNYQLGPPLGANFPATSQYVTAVGGTSLYRASNTRGWSEMTWNDGLGGGAGGSGCSLYYPKPSWQKDTLCKKRMTADVSAVADPNTGVAMYGPITGTKSGWQVYGGTSVSAPLVGGIYGANGGTVTLGSPYGAGVTLNDVTYGTNGAPKGQSGYCYGTYYCNAYKGYDGPTGLGTPTGENGF
jgi:subtilase family serine protease